jgi:excisionase family DNA binding protein
MTNNKLGYSVKNACETLEISRGTLHKLVKAGDVKVARVGRKIIVPHAEIIKLLGGEK